MDYATVDGANGRRLRLRATQYSSLPPDLSKAMAWVSFPFVEDEPMPATFIDEVREIIHPPLQSDELSTALARSAALIEVCENFDIPEMMQVAIEVRDLLSHEVGDADLNDVEGSARDGWAVDEELDGIAQFITAGLEAIGAMDDAGMVSVAPAGRGPLHLRHLERALSASSPLARLVGLHVLLNGGAAETLLDVLSPRLRHLADEAGLTASLASTPLVKFVSTDFVRRNSVDVDAFKSLLAGHKAFPAIASTRVFCAAEEETATLQELGEQLGYTRERVRQLEKQFVQALDESGLRRQFRRVAVLVQELLGERVGGDELQARTAAFFYDADPELQNILKWAVISQSDYDLAEGEAQLPQYKTKLRDAAVVIREDPGLALVSEATVDRIRSLLGVEGPSTAGLTELRDDRWIRRDNLRTRIVGAAELLGRASKSEIAEVAATIPERVSSVLSGVEEVVRSDVDIWGLRSDVEEEYTGIVDAIARRIGEAGGVADVAEVTQDVLATFSVSATSVDSYIKSNSFVVTNGRIRVAESADIQLSAAAWEVEGAVKTVHGWAQPIEVHQRNFDGYSLLFHPKVARANGLHLDDEWLVPVDGASAQVSVIWRQRSLNGAEVGRVREPLLELGFDVGDRVYVVATSARVWLLPPAAVEA